MSLFWKRHRNSIDRRAALAGVPVISDNVKIEKADSGLSSVKIRETRRNHFLERFRPRVINKRFELDEFGSFVVDNIDHERTVLEIIRAFQKQFGMSYRESELGVVAFIKILMKRNLVSVMLKREETAAG
ncbi:MAG: PqqD family protein [Kiritimatiellia bacterium]